MACCCESRSAVIVRRLYRQLEKVGIEEFCTDHWPSFTKVLPEERRKIGKDFTKHIEGLSTCIRAGNRRFARRATCFPKKKENHLASLNLMFAHRNAAKTKHHTF